MRHEVRVVRTEPDCETRELFENLARAVDEGEIVGAIVIAFRSRSCSGKRYFLNLTGCAANNPTHACGALSACHLLLQELALEEAGLL